MTSGSGAGEVDRTFEEIVSEAVAAPIRGWDFSWLEGRATEERPPWGYSRLVAERLALASAALDVQSGGGEMLAALPRLAPLTVVTEGWAPNVRVASRLLRARGAHVVAAESDRPGLPFQRASFDLVTSRHPVTTWWAEIARVLRPGGVFLSQQVGPRSVGELTEFMMGPQPSRSHREPARARAEAEAAGLRVARLEPARLRAVFKDVGAVIYFLRLVIWIVPDFTVDRYRSRLADLHRRIEAEGPFVAHATRFLIQAEKPF